MRLFAWFLLGLVLRCIGLGTLPPWTDECATLVFSLGNSFLGVPLNEFISPDQLLEPLQRSPTTGLGDVWQHLMSESTHPPLYFLFNHLWLQGFPQEQLLWASRAFSAFWGALTIPALYGLAKRSFASETVAELAAALMALSPLGIFLAQEARHYTLAILLAIASFYAFSLAVESLVQNHSPARHWLWGWTFFWIFVNGLGIAVHYFFGLVPLIQGLVLGKHWCQGRLQGPISRTAKPWRGVGVAAVGTAVAGLVWLPVWRRFADSDLTDWVTDGDLGIFPPLGRTILWLVSMVLMAPLDALVLPLWWIVITGLILLFILWKVWQLLEFFSPHHPPQSRIWLEVFIVGLLLFLGITYLTGNDLTLAPRFFFPLLPIVILVLASGLETLWNRRSKQLYILAGIALLGSLSVVTNFSYLQHHRGDRLAQVIRQTSDVPVVLATTHKHHGQTGRLQAIAWDLAKYNFSQSQYFLLAHPEPQAYPTDILAQELQDIPPPFDVWYVNFHAHKLGDRGGQFAAKEPIGERVPRRQLPKINGYRYDLVRYR